MDVTSVLWWLVKRSVRQHLNKLPTYGLVCDVCHSEMTVCVHELIRPNGRWLRRCRRCGAVEYTQPSRYPGRLSEGTFRELIQKTLPHGPRLEQRFLCLRRLRTRDASDEQRQELLVAAIQSADCYGQEHPPEFPLDGWSLVALLLALPGSCAGGLVVGTTVNGIAGGAVFLVLLGWAVQTVWTNTQRRWRAVIGERLIAGLRRVNPSEDELRRALALADCPHIRLPDVLRLLSKRSERIQLEPLPKILFDLELAGHDDGDRLAPVSLFEATGQTAFTAAAGDAADVAEREDAVELSDGEPEADEVSAGEQGADASGEVEEDADAPSADEAEDDEEAAVPELPRRRVRPIVLDKQARGDLEDRARLARRLLRRADQARTAWRFDWVFAGLVVLTLAVPSWIAIEQRDVAVAGAAMAALLVPTLWRFMRAPQRDARQRALPPLLAKLLEHQVTPEELRAAIRRLGPKESVPVVDAIGEKALVERLRAARARRGGHAE